MCILVNNVAILIFLVLCDEALWWESQSCISEGGGEEGGERETKTHTQREPSARGIANSFPKTEKKEDSRELSNEKHADILIEDLASCCQIISNHLFVLANSKNKIWAWMAIYNFLCPILFL